VGIVALLLVSSALVMAQVPAASFLAIPLATLGLVVGLVGLVAAGEGTRAAYIVPACASTLAVGLILVLWFGPTLLDIDPRRQAPPPAEDDPRMYEIPFDRPAARREIGEAEWVDAGKAYVQHHGVRVSVARTKLHRLLVAVQAVPTTNAAGRNETGPPRLVIRLRIVQVVAGAPVRYASWGNLRADAAAPKLVDNLGRKYRLVASPGPSASQELAPGRPVIDAIVFEAPLADVSFLKLELPASAYGQEGTIRLRIAGSAIAF
jgi:hypothetical protein